MTTHTADTDHELLPLLVLAPQPPGSTQPLASSETEGRRAVLFQSEFGYDCRVGDQGAGYSEDRRGKRGFLLVSAGLLVAAGLLLTTQPAAREAMGSLFGGHGSTPAPSPAATSSVLSVTDNNGNVAPTPTDDSGNRAGPVSTTSSSGGATTPAGPVHLTGSYAVAPTGAATTTCTNGVATPQKCVWTLNIASGAPLYLSLSGNNGALGFSVTSSDSTVLYSGSTANGPATVSFNSPPSSITLQVTFTTPTPTNFDLTASATPI